MVDLERAGAEFRDGAPARPAPVPDLQAITRRQHDRRRRRLVAVTVCLGALAIVVAISTHRSAPHQQVTVGEGSTTQPAISGLASPTHAVVVQLHSDGTLNALNVDDGTTLTLAGPGGDRWSQALGVGHGLVAMTTPDFVQHQDADVYAASALADWPNAQPIGHASGMVLGAAGTSVWLQQANGTAQEVLLDGSVVSTVQVGTGTLAGSTNRGLIVEVADAAGHPGLMVSTPEEQHSIVTTENVAPVFVAAGADTLAWRDGNCSSDCRLHLTNLFNGRDTLVSVAGLGYEGSTASLSPDGKALVVGTRDPAGFGVGVVDIATATVRYLTPTSPEVPFEHVVWSSQGRSAFVARATDLFALALLDDTMVRIGSLYPSAVVTP